MDTQTNINNYSNIINNYDNIYIYSKKYLISILGIIIGIILYIFMNNFGIKGILQDTQVSKIINTQIMQNPFELQKLGSESGLVLPKNSQGISESIDDDFDIQKYMNQYIYQNPNNSGAALEYHINKKTNGGKSDNAISINNDIVGYFNLSCATNVSIFDFSKNKLCQRNLDIFANTFSEYKIEEDLLGFETLVGIGNPDHKDIICQNLIQYIYKQGKIYANFDIIMSSCPKEKSLYNSIVDTKRFLRDEQNIYNNKKYNSIDVNDMKLLSRMQDVYLQINDSKINLVEIKKYINFLGQKTYTTSTQNDKLQNIIYILNNKIKEKLNIYKAQESLGIQSISYTNSIIDEIISINSGLVIDDIYKQNSLTGSLVDQISTTRNQENQVSGDQNIIDKNSDTSVINTLIYKYIPGSKIDEYKPISINKYLYKISIGNTKRGFLVIKNNQNIRMMKTLFVGKSNGIYNKVNDFSVNLDDSEQKRFDAFMSKYQDIYNKLSKE